MPAASDRADNPSIALHGVRSKLIQSKEEGDTYCFNTVRQPYDSMQEATAACRLSGTAIGQHAQALWKALPTFHAHSNVYFITNECTA
jgi:hypothetical protein